MIMAMVMTMVVVLVVVAEGRPSVHRIPTASIRRRRASPHSTKRTSATTTVTKRRPAQARPPPAVPARGHQAEELARALRALPALQPLALLQVLQRRGQQRLGDERVLPRVRVRPGEVVQGLDGVAAVPLQDAAEAAEEAEAQHQRRGEQP